MKKLASAFALLCVASTASCGQPQNPLIGTWTVDAKQEAGCKGPLVFTATTYTAPDFYDKIRTMPVTYVTGDAKAYPMKIYLVTDAGIANHVMYTFANHDRMVEDSTLQCHYVRG